MQKVDIEKLISFDCVPPQIYTYPPRKLLSNQGLYDSINSLWNDSSLPSELGIYIHFPFWKYKCVYCNLYAFEYETESIVEMYVGALCQQLKEQLPILRRSKITTIHLGGGDPLLIGFQQLKRIVELLDSVLLDWNSEIVEFSIESTPLSVIQAERNDDITKLIQLGVNRINIGAAPYRYDKKGIVKRIYQEDFLYDAINILKKHDISNISIDLLLGVENETISDWNYTIKKICALQPDTVTFLPLTVRRDSQYGKDKNISLMTSNDYYQWYDIGKKVLFDFGYMQQNSARFILKNGGNIQEDNHFSLGSILGIGAGARSYNVVADYVINPGYNGIQSILRYIELIEEQKLMNIVYYSEIFTKEELLRKRLILEYTGISKEDIFKIDDKFVSSQILKEVQYLTDKGYYYSIDNVFYFTELGMKYHDLICLAYYSGYSRNSDPDLWLPILEI